MLCLSGFELYSRWVPLNSFEKTSQHCLPHLLASLQCAFVSYSHDQFEISLNSLSIIKPTINKALND